MTNDEPIELSRDSITTLAVDAIVNASNTTLIGGAGVDAAIQEAAGPELQAECRILGGCPTGQARITRGYRLPAKFVIHTVGPIWCGGQNGEPALLAYCYRNCFSLACENSVKSIAFPAISCGAFGYPISDAARIAIRETRLALKSMERIERVIFVCFTDEVVTAYRTALSDYAK
ncbi:MAG TPA: O-acetyl-ADP-ribose deacetylase [Verrucomicrobiae bacterium]|nr:O-acetyl-ADP-ribose deacetylase [Verrucomicrobiae bacterium]